MHGIVCRPRHVFLTTDAVGGVWRYSLAVAAGFAAQGWRCTVAAMGPSPDSRQRYEAASIDGCDLLDTGLPLDWTAPHEEALADAAAWLSQAASGASSVHVHSPALAAFSWPAPVIAVAHSCVGTWWRAVHGSAPPRDLQWRMALMEAGLRRADAVIAPSEAIARDLREVYGIARPIDVVFNGLDAVPCVGVLRGDRVLTAGRLWDRGKNLAVLDQACRVLERGIDAAGPVFGPDGARFVGAGLNLLGNLERRDLQVAMASAAIFASPSLYEPFGLAVLEAAQLGTPLVLADIPTFRELWDGAAMFVNPADGAGWARALRSLLDDRTERAVLGERALARSARYGAGAMVAATDAVHCALTRESV